jgi:membrane fusion protein, copper/silver efflux system
MSHLAVSLFNEDICIKSDIYMIRLFYLPILFFGFVLCLSGCASQEKTPMATDNSVMKAYLNLKNALYEGDRAKAEIMAKNMSRALENFTAGDTADWGTAAQQMRAPLDSIALAKEIKEQRVHFEKLSTALYDNARKFGLVSGTLYHQFCPMAFDNKGAYWLSDKEEIENPYFGDEMPHCGEVKDTLEMK